MPVVAKYEEYANNGGWRAEHSEYFRIRATATTIYLDGLKVNGKRKRFFSQPKQAKEELKKWDKRIRKEGEDALAIPQESRILAAKCAKRLERMRGSVPVTVLFADYLATKRRAKLSERHLADIKQSLGRFVADFSERAIKTLTGTFACSSAGKGLRIYFAGGAYCQVCSAGQAALAAELLGRLVQSDDQTSAGV